MGHKLDVPALWSEQMGAVVAKQNELAADAYVTGQSLEDMRIAYRNERAYWNEGGPTVAHTADHRIPTRYGDVRIRLYRATEDDAPQPVIIYTHGGGWVIGDVDTHDRITRTLCHLTGATVISIDYTLAPEAQYPHQIHECVDVVSHLRKNAEHWHIDPHDISFAGDSAGANMAFATLLMLRDEKLFTNARAMMLFYGAYGLRDSMSMRLLGGSWDGLTENDYAYYLGTYFANADDFNKPYANILGADLGQDIPPTYLVAAGLDPLRDDTRTLNELLNIVGVQHTFHEFDGVIHGFMHHSKMLDDTMTALREAAEFFTAQRSA